MPKQPRRVSPLDPPVVDPAEPMGPLDRLILDMESQIDDNHWGYPVAGVTRAVVLEWILSLRQLRGRRVPEGRRVSQSRRTPKRRTF